MPGKDSYNFMWDFHCIGYVHQQKGGIWITSPELPIRTPAQALKIIKIDRLVSYVLNRHNRSYEREYCVGRTISSATDWLEPNNSHRSLFLWIDMWNPHEPFDCPCYGFELYGDSGPRGLRSQGTPVPGHPLPASIRSYYDLKLGMKGD